MPDPLFTPVSLSLFVISIIRPFYHWGAAGNVWVQEGAIVSTWIASLPPDEDQSINAGHWADHAANAGGQGDKLDGRYQLVPW